MTAKKYILIILILLSVSARADKWLVIFDQANEAFRQANSANDPDQAKKLYESSILTFEKIIEQGNFKNAKLYYNLGNAYFLKGDIGKAVLNYRRAEKLDSSDSNIQKNLNFARSKRIDKVVPKTQKKVMRTLFFWHYDFALKTRFILTCAFWGIACLCITGMIWLGRNAGWMTPVIICGLLTLCLLTSVFVETTAQANKTCGVITADEVIARQGDGQNYSPSFKEPLHTGTEFDVIEIRPGWLNIKLFDDSLGWIPENSAELI